MVKNRTGRYNPTTCVEVGVGPAPAVCQHRRATGGRGGMRPVIQSKSDLKSGPRILKNSRKSSGGQKMARHVGSTMALSRFGRHRIGGVVILHRVAVGAGVLANFQTTSANSSHDRRFISWFGTGRNCRSGGAEIFRAGISRAVAHVFNFVGAFWNARNRIRDSVRAKFCEFCCQVVAVRVEGRKIG